MEYPKSVLNIIKSSVTKHFDDLDKSVELAKGKIKKLKNYKELIELFVHHAIYEKVCDERHQRNTEMKKPAGGGHTTAKVDPTKHDIVGEIEASVEKSYYEFFIAGRILGNVLGRELEGIAQAEESIASGHQFNADLCRRLAPMVRKNKTVKECVSEARLKKVFTELGA